jgi:hypothetical protein
VVTDCASVEATAVDDSALVTAGSEESSPPQATNNESADKTAIDVEEIRIPPSCRTRKQRMVKVR